MDTVFRSSQGLLGDESLVGAMIDVLDLDYYSTIVASVEDPLSIAIAGSLAIRLNKSLLVWNWQQRCTFDDVLHYVVIDDSMMNRHFNSIIGGIEKSGSTAFCRNVFFRSRCSFIENSAANWAKREGLVLHGISDKGIWSWPEEKESVDELKKSMVIKHPTLVKQLAAV